MLDIDYGTYPYVTSSNTTTAGVCVGLGVAPQRIGKVFGISKSYCTRVGSGPFPTELDNDLGEELRQIGAEFGATTGRPRRTGWIDLPQLKYTIMLNGVNHLCITKMDCLNTFKEIMAATSYKVAGEETTQLPYDLESDVEPQYTSIKGWHQDINAIRDFNLMPSEVKDYIQYLEDYLGVPVTMLSTGPGREELIVKGDLS